MVFDVGFWIFKGCPVIVMYSQGRETVIEGHIHRLRCRARAPCELGRNMWSPSSHPLTACRCLQSEARQQGSQGDAVRLGQPPVAHGVGKDVEQPVQSLQWNPADSLYLFPCKEIRNKDRLTLSLFRWARSCSFGIEMGLLQAWWPLKA